MKRHILMFLVLISLSACGVKPGAVEPPSGVQSDQFPHTYPNIHTDPRPAE